MKKPKKRVMRRVGYSLMVVVLLGGYCGWALYRPLNQLAPVSGVNKLQASAKNSLLAWPAAGQSAVGIVGSDILESHGLQAAAPIASTAKVITALTVLEQKPLSAGQQGPAITLTDADVAIYKNYVAQDGSLVPVVAGEQISEYQMLQAIMLPSANNIADSMAIWAFGSLPAYASAGNAYLAEHSLTSTHVGADASGFSPTTTSTAADLVRLGKLAMQNPVLASIAGQSTATGIPMTTSVKNVNGLLGSSGIIGIKTGNTEQAGGVFMSASKVTVNDKPVTIVTAVVGSPTLFVALKDSLALVKSSQSKFSPVTIVRAGDVVGKYKLPWGGTSLAIADRDLGLRAWNGSTIKAAAYLDNVSANTPADAIVGIISLPDSALSNKKTVSIKLKQSIAEPTVWWRIKHPY